jgi:hypothetical protein
VNPNPSNVSDLSDPRVLAAIIREQRSRMRQLEVETAATLRRLADRLRVAEQERDALRVQRDAAITTSVWGGRVVDRR